jgi:hypothetical protein
MISAAGGAVTRAGLRRVVSTGTAFAHVRRGGRHPAHPRFGQRRVRLLWVDALWVDLL